MAEHRHRRETVARRKPRAVLVAGPLAVAATASFVTLGVALGGPAAQDLIAQDAAAQTSVAGGARAAADRSGLVDPTGRTVVSRSGSRLSVEGAQVTSDRGTARAATARAVRRADTRLWTTTLLNLWSSAADDATNVGELAAGKHVLVTGRKSGDRVEIVVKGEARWVTAGYLSADEPEEEPAAAGAAAGLSMAPCPDSGVESGLTANAVRVYRSVCHAFPQITSYGGWDNHGEHSSGRALDIMTSDAGLGTAIAEFLRSHAAELHLYDILWRQRIWTPVRASEGWRSMPSRGSATADHYDHVHVATY